MSRQELANILLLACCNHEGSLLIPGWLHFADWAQGRLYRMPLAGGEIARVLDRLTDPAGLR